MLHRRAGCAAAALPDGRLLVTGGYDQKGIVDGLLPSCEVFDPTTQAWELHSASLTRARWGHGCAVLGGKVYAIGGCSLRPGTPSAETNMETLSSCEVFDPASQVWQKHAAPLRRARWGHGCAVLGGKVYAIGGCSLRPGAPVHEVHMETLSCCEIFDPSSGSWSAGPSMQEARAGARVVTLGDRYLAAVGGCNDVFGRAEILPTIELFDSQAGAWQMLEQQLTTRRTTAAVAALDDDSILIAGGAPSLSSVEVYRLPRPFEGDGSSQMAVDQEKRARVSSIAEGRMGCQAANLRLPGPGKTYPLCERPCVVVVGGESGEDSGDSEARQLSSVLVYDTKTDAWWPQDAFPPMPTPRTAMALVVGPGKVVGCP